MNEQPELFDLPQYKTVIGSDEAGRGPLAGPVCVAAVVLPPDFPKSILNDSKKMTEKQREYAYNVIKEKAISYSIKFISHKKIDEINILNASLLGMKLSSENVISKLKAQNIVPDIVLVDGNKTPDITVIPVAAIVKGDSKIPEIMAASILAKVTRDRFMMHAAEKWKYYGFEKNKGYPTKDHKEALRKYGPCPIHRLTFNY